MQPHIASDNDSNKSCSVCESPVDKRTRHQDLCCKCRSNLKSILDGCVNNIVEQMRNKYVEEQEEKRKAKEEARNQKLIEKQREKDRLKAERKAERQKLRAEQKAAAAQKNKEKS